MSYVLAIDQGTTSSRAILFDDRMGAVASAQEEFPQPSPAPAGSSTIRPTSGRPPPGPAAPAWSAPGSGAEEIAAVGITNQRETTLVWDRATGAPLGNAIVWQDRRTAAALRRAARRRPRGDDHRAHRAPARPLLLRHQAQMAARRARGRARARAGGRAPVRHRRQLPDLEADRRPGARDRRHQRRPHAALQHPRRRLGRGHLRAPRRADGDAAGGQGLRRRLRRDPGRPLRPRHPDPRGRRRPAGGDDRPGLLPARAC